MVKKIESIESLRFILFIGIFLFHSVGGWFPIGWGGVQAFLVISSFFLTSKLISTDRKQIKPCLLFWNRILRIYPAYLLLVVLASLGYIISKRAFPNDFIWYIFSAQNFYWSFHNFSSPIIPFTAHTWYITLDIYLFLIWIVLFKITPIEKRKLMCFLCILFAVCYRYISILYFNNIFLTYTMPWAMLDAFGIGGLLALSVNKQSANKNCLPEIIFGFTGILLCIVYVSITKHIPLLKAYQSFRSAEGYANSLLLVNIYIFISVLTVGVLKYCLFHKHTILENHVLVKLGGMSYPLYLFHWPILVLLKMIVHNPFIIISAGMALSILAAWIWNEFMNGIRGMAKNK